MDVDGGGFAGWDEVFTSKNKKSKSSADPYSPYLLLSLCSHLP